MLLTSLLDELFHFDLDTSLLSTVVNATLKPISPFFKLWNLSATSLKTTRHTRVKLSSVARHS